MATISTSCKKQNFSSVNVFQSLPGMFQIIGKTTLQLLGLLLSLYYRLKVLMEISRCLYRLQVHGKHIQQNDKLFPKTKSVEL